MNRESTFADNTRLMLPEGEMTSKLNSNINYINRYHTTNVR